MITRRLLLLIFCICRIKMRVQRQNTAQNLVLETCVISCSKCTVGTLSHVLANFTFLVTVSFIAWNPFLTTSSGGHLLAAGLGFWKPCSRMPVQQTSVLHCKCHPKNVLMLDSKLSSGLSSNAAVNLQPCKS